MKPLYFVFIVFALLMLLPAAPAVAAPTPAPASQDLRDCPWGYPVYDQAMHSYYISQCSSGFVAANQAVAGSAVLAQDPANAKAVPFKGSWESSEVPTFAPAPPPAATTMYVDGKAWGNATHIGKYTATFEATVDLACGCSQGDTVHFIAANGDSVYGIGAGSGVPSDTPGFMRVVQTYAISDGTGRFAGAGGTFTVTRLANNATGVSSGSIDGSIVMPTGK